MIAEDSTMPIRKCHIICRAPYLKKSREKAPSEALRIKTVPFLLQFLLHGTVALLLMD